MEKYVAAYAAALDIVDVVVFTGGIGETYRASASGSAHT